MQAGENVISTDFDLEPGIDVTMYIYENAGLFSITNPNEINFPYVSDEGTVTITSSNNNEEYNFFFNLKFKSNDGTLCQSERKLVQAVLDTDVSTNNLVEAFSIELHPNPSSGILNIETSIENRNKMIIEIYDGIGKEVRHKVFNQTLDISDLPKGVYYINFTNDKGTVTRKVVLQ